MKKRILLVLFILIFCVSCSRINIQKTSLKTSLSFKEAIFHLTSINDYKEKDRSISVDGCKIILKVPDKWEVYPNDCYEVDEKGTNRRLEALTMYKLPEGLNLTEDVCEELELRYNMVADEKKEEAFDKNIYKLKKGKSKQGYNYIQYTDEDTNENDVFTYNYVQVNDNVFLYFTTFLDAIYKDDLSIILDSLFFENF